MTPGQRIREAREMLEPKLSTKKLDELAGRPKGSVWSLEKSGGEHAESATLDAIARALGMSMDWLVRGEGEAPSKEAVARAVEDARAVVATNKAAAKDRAS